MHYTGLIIKELRNKYKLSQQDLSDATSIPKGRINGWEQKNSTPSVGDYKIIERYFSQLGEDSDLMEDRSSDYTMKYIQLLEKTNAALEGHLGDLQRKCEQLNNDLAILTKEYKASSKSAAAERLALSLQSRTLTVLLQQVLVATTKMQLSEVVSLTNKIYADAQGELQP